MNNIVSVIIIIYNDENLIRRSVDSIIMQTYSNLEIILVTDGARDKCREICDDYARKDSRIKLVDGNLKGGSSEAKNLGLKIMTGDYVYILDGSDYVVDNLIEIALLNALESSADLVVFNYNKIDEYDNLLSPVRFNPAIYEIDDHNRLSYIINNLNQYRSRGWQVGNRLFKAEIIRKNNMCFWDNNLISTEDLGFSLNYTLYLSKISYIADVLYYYKVRKDSVRAQSPKEPRIKEATRLCRLIEDKVRTSFMDAKVKKKYLLLIFALMNDQLAKLHSYNYLESLSSLEDISCIEDKSSMNDKSFIEKSSMHDKSFIDK
ncbi:MAG: glycosyltransferase family 2 protein, partial [Anaerolineaceae bacterium]